MNTDPHPQSLTRRKCLRDCLVLAAATALQPRANAAPAGLPASLDLRVELAQALAKNQPLVVMVSLSACPFCITVRASHLLPMLAGGQSVVQVDMRSNALTADFDGQRVSHDQLVRAWGVKVAPSLLFFGAGGVQVAPRMDGAYLPDFYGAYLDQRLVTARKALPKPG
jgi:hypothetical protein